MQVETNYLTSFHWKGVSLKKCQLYILLFKVTKHCTQWNKVYRDIDRFVKIDVYMVLLLSPCTASKTCKKILQQNELDWN